MLPPAATNTANDSFLTDAQQKQQQQQQEEEQQEQEARMATSATMDIGKTPLTTDWQQIQILCQRNLRKDIQKPTLWFARTVAVALMLMMYTVGFYLNYIDVEQQLQQEEQDNNNKNDGTETISTSNGDFILHPGNPWTYPSKVILGGSGSGGSALIIDDNEISINGSSSTKLQIEDQEGNANGNPNDENNHFNADYQMIAEVINLLYPNITVTTAIPSPSTLLSIRNVSTTFAEFQTYCHDNIEIPYTDVCVFINDANTITAPVADDVMTENGYSYRILYGGNGVSGITPYEPVFAGMQSIMTSSILFLLKQQQHQYEEGNNSTFSIGNNTSDLTFAANEFIATQIQRVPERTMSLAEISNETRGIGFTIGFLTAMAVVITSQFVMAPVLTERKQEVTQAFVRVGVRLRTYMIQWILYLSVNSIISACALTAVAVGWNLYPQSSAGLIFLSFYLVLVQLNIMLVLFSQVAPQEEFASSASFIFFVISVAISAVILFLVDQREHAEWLMSLTSVASPYIGIVNFSIRYYQYDLFGVGTGIQVMDGGTTFRESGLLGTYLGSAGGIVISFAACIIFSTPRLSKQFSRIFSPKRHPTTRQAETTTPNNNSNSSNGQERREGEQGLAHERSNSNNRQDLVIEELSSQADVLLHTNSIQHTYFPGCCSGDKKPTEVLHGVNLDVCRNSVLGLLGHNGCGKSTTIKILSGEVDLQEGLARYNFLDGTVELVGEDGNRNDNDGTPLSSAVGPIDVDAMKRKIGVCPQHNNLLGDESCRETLRLFASLRGNLPQQPNQSINEAIDAEVDRIIEQIDFTSSEDADKPVGTYSGGMKRKVSIGIALIGDPEIIFLDEPSAGLDPYNRRTIWDLIISAKKNRSIVLCSHHLEEVDLLSDRVAIMNDGYIVACGSPLFLKHHYGGYSLRFEASEQLDVSQYVSGAKTLPMEKPLHFQWRIEHGSEPQFANLLQKLDEHGAKNVALELTTLEQVFLETSKEEQYPDSTVSNADQSDNESDSPEVVNLDHVEDKTAWLGKIWEKRGDVKVVSFWGKFFLVQDFMNKNAWKQKGAIIVNVTFPLVYMVLGLVVVYLVGEPEPPSLIEPDAIPISPFLLPQGNQNVEFFGVPNSIESLIYPVVTEQEPDSFDYFFQENDLILGGYWSQNATVQYNPEITPFALQLAELITSTAALKNNFTSGGLHVTHDIQELPYTSGEPFRVDFLVLPIALVFGFTGMVLSILDILTLKANNAVSLFRVAGVNEWTVYLGVMYYKCTTTFIPFFTLTMILSLVFANVLLGNGGRWLATVLTMLLFAYSSTPLGLIVGKRFIHSNFDSVKGWFPGAYFTLISLPYLAWNLAYQNLPDARDAILIVGDFLCVIPPVAFQRSLGAIIEVSLYYNDPNLTWGGVWVFETRVLLSILLMFGIGTLEWVYLYHLTSARPAQTKLMDDNDRQPESIDDDDVLEEKSRSKTDDDGINAREVVKVFSVDVVQDGTKTRTLKKAVKGVDFGIKKNEIYVLLGPNGAGKTSLMSTIAAEYTPEHGSIAIDGRIVGPDERSTDHMFDRCNVSWCPQEDALFPFLSVEQHLEFYARIRGLSWGSNSATQHIEAIVRLLGLSKHVKKLSTELSGGYKRRLSLAIAMIGYPTSMLVDECTTGVDPAARHLIWGVLQPDLINESYDLPAILLSTHYMDEAAKLASRIGIMINGEMIASGTLDRLKERYCGSYFIEIAIGDDAPDTAEDDTLLVFKSRGMEATVYERIPFNFKLQVPFLASPSVGSSSTSSLNSSRIQQLITIFDLLESKKTELGIKFYSVAQMSLEQIFIDLSRKQFDADESMREVVTSHRHSQ